MQENNKKNGVTTDDIMNFLVGHMATKEELQYEIGKLRSDVIDQMNKNTLQLETTFGVMMRTEDQKVGALVNLLTNKHVISVQEAGLILKMTPFPVA